MAGDWIKMRVDLGDDPAVIGISEMLGLSEDTVVGKLHRLWSWADKHTTNGATNGVTLRWVDRFVANQGFADALCKFNWLQIDGDTLIFPNFDRHNGASAKARVEATLRQRLSRKNRDEGVTGIERVITPRPFVKFVLERDGNRCVYCGHIPTGKESLGVDHLLPLTRGGKDAIENLVSCCNSCNNEKNDRTPEEFGLLPTFLMPNVTYVSQQICDKRVTVALPEKRREEKINTTTMSEYSDEFEQFWKAYPKKTGKGNAWKSWKKEKPSLQSVLKALDWQRQLDDWKKESGQYIPLPATYLNQRRFDDGGGVSGKPYDQNEFMRRVGSHTMNQMLNFKNILNEDIDIEKWMSEEHKARVATVAQFVPQVMDMVEGIGEKAHPTPWKEFNGRFGFRDSELTIWSGFKGHGKSLVISQVFEKFITDGKKCFIISPEFPPHRVLYRMMIQSMGIHSINTQNAWEWLIEIEKKLWLYDQQSSLKAQDVVALCRYAVEVHGVEHILIDSLMKCGIAPDDYGTQKKLVDMVQQVAHKNKVHIHLVAHARKSNDDAKIGGLHDVKGSSEICDMAENVIFVWRNKNKEFNEGKIDEPDCIVKIEAQRNGDGWIGTVPLNFDKHTFTFRSIK